jgi:hypothetical protein
MKTKLIFIVTMLSLSGLLSGQEEQWEPQKKVTGYLSLEGNYFNNLKFFTRDYALAVPEAGILFTYQPIEKLTFKGVFVYRPVWSFKDMVSEISAEWKLNDGLKIKAGHMLTPLSPINTFFYAPMNLGIALPILVSLHENYPINMEAISFNGTLGDKFKIDYNAFGGGYFNSVGLPTGAMSFFGQEDSYFSAISNHSTFSPSDFSSSVVNGTNLQYGAGAHLGFSLQDYVQVGLNVFHGNEKTSDGTDSLGNSSIRTTNKLAFGINFKIKYNTLQLSGESWNSNFDWGNGSSTKVKESFIDLSNSFGKFTPYAKYEWNMLFGGNISRYIVGLNFKPIFETTFKLEWFAYNKENINGMLFAAVYSF